MSFKDEFSWFTRMIIYNVTKGPLDEKEPRCQNRADKMLCLLEQVIPCPGEMDIRYDNVERDSEYMMYMHT